MDENGSCFPPEGEGGKDNKLHHHCYADEQMNNTMLK
jgi:hypothetical protein